MTRRTIGGLILAVMYLISLCGGFIAPYNHRNQNRETPYLPPVRVHFDGMRPVVYGQEIADRLIFSYREVPEQKSSVHFFVRGDEYYFLGFIRSNRHLFGVEGKQRVSLLGTDELGRDVFARLLYAGQISLVVGPLGLVLAYLIGGALGAVFGYLGGAGDSLVMRASEMMMSLPMIMLVLAIRAAFPLTLGPGQIVGIMVAIFALVGWAEIARLTRNLTLSERGREYVASAVSVGASRSRIVFRHILPNISDTLLTQFALSAPVFILAEVTLSFLGVGVQEPGASWGTMLAVAKDLAVLRYYWWMLAPVVCIFLVGVAFQLIGESSGSAGD